MVVVFQQGAGLWHSVNRTAGYFLCWAFSALVGTKTEKKHFMQVCLPRYSSIQSFSCIGFIFSQTITGAIEFSTWATQTPNTPSENVSCALLSGLMQIRVEAH